MKFFSLREIHVDVKKYAIFVSSLYLENFQQDSDYRAPGRITFTFSLPSTGPLY
jgi:hypothetical protein